WLTPWGETSPGIEQTLQATPGNQTVVATSTFVPGATKTRLYIGYQTGQYSQYQEVSLANLANGATVTITCDGTQTQPSTPPRKNAAFLPDSDGTFVSAALA